MIFYQGGDEEASESPTKQSHASPVKTVLSKLQRQRGGPNGPNGKKGTSFKNKSKRGSKLDTPFPHTIEDVPFRRQDKRILNARKKRLTDRKLYKCLMFTGVLILLFGASLISLYILWKEDFLDNNIWRKAYVQPFLIIGPMITVCGIMVVIFSVEICVRYKKNARRVQDPEIDTMKNIHHIKHWMDPAIIPFGWAQENDLNYNETHEEYLNHNPGIEISDRATLKGSAAAVKALNSVSPINDQSFSNHQPQNSSVQESDNPHEIMAIEMTKTSETSDATAMLVENDGNDIPSDIFDESLRYSGIDRPRFFIEVAETNPSDNKQRRGSFVPDEDRIANLFSPKKKDK